MLLFALVHPVHPFFHSHYTNLLHSEDWEEIAERKFIMGFDTGPVTFRRFQVIGAALDTSAVLTGAEPHILHPQDVAISEDVIYGWSGGEHVLDATLTHGKNVYADCVLFALRIDTNKPPAELVKAYTKQEEAAVAAGNPSGFISKLQKRDVKEGDRTERRGTASKRRQQPQSGNDLCRSSSAQIQS